MKREALAIMILVACLLVAMPIEVALKTLNEEPTYKIIIHGEPVQGLYYEARKAGVTVQLFEMDLLKRVGSSWEIVVTYYVTMHAYGEGSHPGHWGENGDTPPSFINENGYFWGRVSNNKIILSDNVGENTIFVPTLGERIDIQMHKRGPTAMHGCVGIYGKKGADDSQEYDDMYDAFIGILEGENFQVHIEPAPIDPMIYHPLKLRGEEEVLSILKERERVTFAASNLGGVDFRSIHLNYISEPFDAEFSHFYYLIETEKAESGDEIIDIQTKSGETIDFFFIGLTLPNHTFWVNLNPWEPERIIDKDLGSTDAGRIMLEADLQMKKDFCRYENPCESDVGAEYWTLLDRKREELIEKCMNEYPGEIESVDNVFFSAATRHWIVPDRITAYGGNEELFIVDATLKIYSEPVYEHSTYKIVDQSDSVSKSCQEYLSEAAKEYGRYAKELEEEMILPLVVNEVNTGSQYADLRQVYVSLALAQWYKSHYGYGQHLFSDYINSETLDSLKSRVPWDPEQVWDEYVISYQEGEYYCEKEYKEGNYIITKIYTSGGVDFENIEEHISIIDVISSKIKKMISEAMLKPFMEWDDSYYFGDRISTYTGSSAGGPGPTTPPPDTDAPPEGGGGPESSTPPPDTDAPRKDGKIVILVLLLVLALVVGGFLAWRIVSFIHRD